MSSGVVQTPTGNPSVVVVLLRMNRFNNRGNEGASSVGSSSSSNPLQLYERELEKLRIQQRLLELQLVQVKRLRQSVEEQLESERNGVVRDTAAAEDSEHDAVEIVSSERRGVDEGSPHGETNENDDHENGKEEEEDDFEEESPVRRNIVVPQRHAVLSHNANGSSSHVREASASAEMPSFADNPDAWKFPNLEAAMTAISKFEGKEGYTVQRNSRAKGAKGGLIVLTCVRCPQSNVEWRIGVPKTVMDPVAVRRCARNHQCRTGSVAVPESAAAAANSADDPSGGPPQTESLP